MPSTNTTTDLESLCNLWESTSVWSREHKAFNTEGGIYGKFFPKDASDTGIHLQGTTRFGRHTDFWSDLARFLVQLPPHPGLSIVITAMSVGCDVYEFAKLCKDYEVSKKHPDAKIFGHDLSARFTKIAKAGLYPKGSRSSHKRMKDMLIECDPPYEQFIEIHPNIKKEVTILPPGDVRDLKKQLDGPCDVLVSNFINPCPPGIDDVIKDNSRHLACSNQRYIGISPEWAGHYHDMDFKSSRISRDLSL